MFENLSRTLFAPSVQMQGKSILCNSCIIDSTFFILIEVPRDQDMSEDEDEQDADDRYSRKKHTNLFT